MSHYTVGVGSSPELQRYARQANKARSTVLKHALTAIGTRIGHIWRKRQARRQLVERTRFETAWTERLYAFGTRQIRAGPDSGSGPYCICTFASITPP